MFEVSAAKAEILRQLVRRDWTPTDLAAELGKSTAAVYNHLDDLAERGLLTRTQVPAKTRPKTEYSIEDGFVHWLVALPGMYQERGLRLDAHKAALIRIWAVPQAMFHPYLEVFWWDLRRDAELSLADDVVAIAVYGSVARGDADQDSDIDVLAVVDDDADVEAIRASLGVVRVEIPAGSKLAMTMLYTTEEYRSSLAQGSRFLDAIRDELHVLHDPQRFLSPPSSLTEPA